MDQDDPRQRLVHLLPHLRTGASRLRRKLETGRFRNSWLDKQCPLSAFDPKRTSFGFLQSVLDFGPTRCWHPLGQKFEKGPSLARVRTYHGQVAVTFPNNRDKEIIPRGSDFDFGGSKPCFCAKPGQELSSRQHPERIAATRLSFPWQCRADLLGQCSGAISAAGAGSQRRAEHRVDPHR